MSAAAYCAWCGAENTAQPCPHCGRTGTTDAPPSQEPCAYCGARPTWPVTWTGQTSTTVFLCAACDGEETHALAAD